MNPLTDDLSDCLVSNRDASDGACVYVVKTIKDFVIFLLLFQSALLFCQSENLFLPFFPPTQCGVSILSTFPLVVDLKLRFFFHEVKGNDLKTLPRSLFVPFFSCFKVKGNNY